MAVWQYDAYLVPGSRVTLPTGRLSERISQHDFDSLQWWEGAALPPRYSEVLSEMLPRGKHWSRDTEFWGQEDGNCISVRKRGDEVEEFRVRFDVRNLNVFFIDRIADAARDWHCVFLAEDFEVVPASSNALQKQIKDSPAYRYLLDPASFLSQGGELP
jgi:hypothetical protein